MSRLLSAAKAPYLLLGLAVLVLDQWSKWLVETRITRGNPVEVIPGFLNFIHVKNTGVAFGLFPAHGDLSGTVVLTVLGLIALSIVGYYFARTPPSDRFLLAALGLILGGAVGNLADRVAGGAVTDFIDAYVGSYHWHTFNVADSAITVGIVIMALDIFLGRRDAGESEAPGDSSTDPAPSSSGAS
jgi:signal peptidase II